MKRNILIVGALVIQGMMSVALADVMNLSDCLKYGLENSPVLKQYIGRTETANGEVDRSKIDRNIHMGANVAWWANRNEMYDYDNMGSNYELSASVWLRATISDFGRSSARIAAAKANLASKRKDLEWMQVQVAGGIKMAYFQVQESKRMMELRKEAMATAQEQFDHLQTLSAVGAAKPFEKSKVNMTLANSKMSYKIAQADYEHAVAGLAKAMGYVGKLELADEKFPVGDLRSIDRENCVKLAMNRPDVASARFQIDNARFLERESARGNRPVLVAEAYNTNNLHSPYENNWNAGVILEFPILDGGQRKAERKERRGVVKTAEGYYEELVVEINAELNKSFSDLDSNYERMSLAQELVSQAKENLALAEERYESGNSSFIDFADAQKEYFAAIENFEKVQFEVLGSLARIDALTGMTPTF